MGSAQFGNGFFNPPSDDQALRVETGSFGSAHVDGGGTYTRIRRAGVEFIDENGGGPGGTTS